MRARGGEVQAHARVHERAVLGRAVAQVDVHRALARHVVEEALPVLRILFGGPLVLIIAAADFRRIKGSGSTDSTSTSKEFCEIISFITSAASHCTQVKPSELNGSDALSAWRLVAMSLM